MLPSSSSLTGRGQGGGEGFREGSTEEDLSLSYSSSSSVGGGLEEMASMDRATSRVSLEKPLSAEGRRQGEERRGGEDSGETMRSSQSVGGSSIFSSSSSSHVTESSSVSPSKRLKGENEDQEERMDHPHLSSSSSSFSFSSSSGLSPPSPPSIPYHPTSSMHDLHTSRSASSSKVVIGSPDVKLSSSTREEEGESIFFSQNPRALLASPSSSSSSSSSSSETGSLSTASASSNSSSGSANSATTRFPPPSSSSGPGVCTPGGVVGGEEEMKIHSSVASLNPLHMNNSNAMATPSPLPPVTSSSTSRRGENKPVPYAPGVVKLAPYDKNVTSSILLSTANFDTVLSVPSIELQEQLERSRYASSSSSGQSLPVSNSSLPSEEKKDSSNTLSSSSSSSFQNAEDSEGPYARGEGERDGMKKRKREKLLLDQNEPGVENEGEKEDEEEERENKKKGEKKNNGRRVCFPDDAWKDPSMYQGEEEEEIKTKKKKKKEEEEEFLPLPDRPPLPIHEHKLKQREEEAYRLEMQGFGLLNYEKKDGTTTSSSGGAKTYHRLPTCSSWFDTRHISQIEHELIPILFAGTGLHGGEREEKYKQIRNLIVVAYRANPLRHLSFSDCRQQVVACDSSLLLRIHSFLDFWGIINFQANPATVPTAVSRRKAFLLKDIKAMEKSRSASVASRPLHAARNLLRDFSSFFPSSSSSSFSSSSSSFFSDIDLEDGSRREGSKFSSSSLPASLGGRGPWRCAACSKICLYSYYILRPACTPGVSLGLLETCVWCMRCFADGRFPSILNPRQFLKVTIPILTGEDEDEEEEATREESTRHNSHTSPSTASTTMHKEGAGTPAGSPQIEESPASSSSSSTNTWTLEDIEKLIEGIEMFKEDWSEVACHVGRGKTAEMCIQKFIQLPIHEPFGALGDSSSSSPYGLDSKRRNLRGEGDSRNCLISHFPNPLLSLVAFLSSCVHPAVASRAAKCALDCAVELGIGRFTTEGEGGEGGEGEGEGANVERNSSFLTEKHILPVTSTLSTSHLNPPSNKSQSSTNLLQGNSSSSSAIASSSCSSGRTCMKASSSGEKEGPSSSSLSLSSLQEGESHRSSNEESSSSSSLEVAMNGEERKNEDSSSSSSSASDVLPSDQVEEGKKKEENAGGEKKKEEEDTTAPLTSSSSGENRRIKTPGAAAAPSSSSPPPEIEEEEDEDSSSSHRSSHKKKKSSSSSSVGEEEKKKEVQETNESASSSSSSSSSGGGKKSSSSSSSSTSRKDRKRLLREKLEEEEEKERLRREEERKEVERWSSGKGYISDRDLQVACAVALSAGAVSAQELAKVEEKHIQLLMKDILKFQMEKIELKMKTLRLLERRFHTSKKSLEEKFLHLFHEHRDLVDDLERTKKELAVANLPSHNTSDTPTSATSPS